MFTPNSERAHACWDVNTFVTLYFLHWFIDALAAWYPGLSLDVERKLLGNTLLMAEEAGIVRFPVANELKKA